jgi:Uma2 family endonuclease
MARVMPAVQQVESEAAYLQLEAAALERHEFVDGQMFLMVGGTTTHNRIAGLLYAKMLEASDQTECEVFIENVKLRCPDGVFYYPDVMLVCQLADDHPYYRTQPCLIAEVLSDSTALIDREEKWQRYRTIPNLQMYVLLAQDAARAETFSRNPDGTWTYAVFENDDVLQLPCVQLSLPVSSLYRGVL